MFFDESSLKESYMTEGFFNQATMGLKIKPHQDIITTLTSHEYPGYLNYINKCNNRGDLIYLRNDINSGIKYFKLIGERIEKCNNLGLSKETNNYYKNIKYKFIDNGITKKDCDKTAKWFETICRKAINNKLNSLNKQIEESNIIKESFNLFDFDLL